MDAKLLIGLVAAWFAITEYVRRTPRFDDPYYGDDLARREDPPPDWDC